MSSSDGLRVKTKEKNIISVPKDQKQKEKITKILMLKHQNKMTHFQFIY